MFSNNVIYKDILHRITSVFCVPLSFKPCVKKVLGLSKGLTFSSQNGIQDDWNMSIEWVNVKIIKTYILDLKAVTKPSVSLQSAFLE